jgi:hypothetical protein
MLVSQIGPILPHGWFPAARGLKVVIQLKKLNPLFCLMLVFGLVVSSTAIVNRSALGSRPKWVGIYRGKGSTAIGPVIDLDARGYLIGGEPLRSTEHKKRLIWTMETTKSGELIWKKLYKAEFQSEIGPIVSTEDGGFLLTGHLTTPGNFNRTSVLVAKGDRRGEIDWSIQLGKNLEDYDPSQPKVPFNCNFSHLIRAHDGGYLAAGFYMPERELEYGNTETEFKPSGYGILVKISREGKVEWQKRYGADGIYSFMSIERAEDGNYFAVGMALPHGEKPQSKTWVVKFDPKGEAIWQKTFAGQTKVGSSSSRKIGQKETGTSFDVTSDGGLIITGLNQIAAEGGFNAEVWIMKLDENGGIEWHKSYGGRGSDLPVNIQETPDGGYVFAGTTDSFGGPQRVFRIWLMKLDENGAIQWERTYGKPGSSSHGGVKVLKDGNLIIQGEMKNQDEADAAGLIMILNEKGELKNLEDTPLEPNPTDARTGVFPISSTREKIPYEKTKIPVSRAEIEVQEDDVGLEFLLKPRDN